MTARVILSVVGSDRPGLTQALADAVMAAGGNWLESHLSRLGGTYVGSVLVALDPAHLATLEDRIRAVDASGLRVSIVPAGDTPDAQGTPLWVELVGQDRPASCAKSRRFWPNWPSTSNAFPPALKIAPIPANCCSA